MESVSAKAIIQGTTAKQRVRIILRLSLIDALPSKMKYYIMGFLGLALLIAGIVYYAIRLKMQMKRYPQLDEDPDSIIGTNPEPSRRGRFGLNQPA
jgi:cbb3-type cytochrome oxidase subunit 1